MVVELSQRTGINYMCLRSQSLPLTTQDALDPCALVCCQFCWKLHLKLDQQISLLPRLLRNWHPFPLNHKLVPWADNVCHLYCQTTLVQCGQLHRGSLECLCQCHLVVDDEVVAISLVDFVGLLIDDEDEVCWKLVQLLVPLVWERDLRSFLPTGLHID